MKSFKPKKVPRSFRSSEQCRYRERCHEVSLCLGHFQMAASLMASPEQHFWAKTTFGNNLKKKHQKASACIDSSFSRSLHTKNKMNKYNKQSDDKLTAVGGLQLRLTLNLQYTSTKSDYRHIDLLGFWSIRSFDFVGSWCRHILHALSTKQISRKQGVNWDGAANYPGIISVRGSP